ncbi:MULTISPECIES: DUF5681 domain-containing protein [Bradyrhizobium]|uniref:DUF5681 domain-containing protein n=2 Tax=Bradyrhizobium quebecense TaxID=2748629 RepID=A0ABS3MW80_9BRAD|nr:MULTISPECIES: DUF5681 domain-containing protein [Bradyrhizobium]UFX49349.1 DUF5681 domain-containing protein [Bradyrhizobium sp. 41S5]UGY07511.1 DUF5681 domain-containing protein [Bradyrhizobium quebecense]
MSDSDKVGRCRPPKESQFGRGQRRASGRPKGARGENAIVQDIATELHRVQLNGREVEKTTAELLLISMRDLAMEGNLKAVKWLNEYRARLDPGRYAARGLDRKGAVRKQVQN